MVFAADANNKKCAPDSGPTLQLDVVALRRHAPRHAPPKKEEIDPLDLQNLRIVSLRQGLTKCRDRHRRARPIICVTFWAAISSLCVAISLFVSPFLFFLNRHQLAQVPCHMKFAKLSC